MSIQFPNVPLSLGVPAVLRNATNLAIAEEIALRPDNSPGVSSNDWGVFDQSGSRILDPDSVISVEFGGEYRISDYPLENGGFQSYNKVAMPFEIRTTMTKGGTMAERQAFMIAVEDLRASLTLVDVATPERVYVGVNLTRVGQVRSPSTGAALVVVEAVFQEVRQTATIAYSQTETAVPPVTAQPSPSSATTSTPTGKWPALTQKTVKVPSATKPINQGSVQAKVTTKGTARVVQTQTGRKLYVYDKPIG